MCVCVCEFEGGRACVCVCVSEFEGGRAYVCVCVCQFEGRESIQGQLQYACELGCTNNWIGQN